MRSNYWSWKMNAANNNNYIQGDITTKIGFFRDKERFSLKGAKDKETETICSIRAKTIKKDSATKPLSWWEKKNWVRVKIGPDNHILLNIESIAKNTGLTKAQIRAAADNQTGDVSLEKLKLLKEAMQESHNLAEGVRSQLSFAKELLDKQGDAERLACDENGNVNLATLCEKFQLTPEQVSRAKKEKLFVPTEIEPDPAKRGSYKCRVTLRIPPPMGKQLKKTVQKIHKFRKEFQASAEHLEDGSNEPRVHHDLVSKKWKGIVDLRVYVNPSGEMYLSSLQELLGKGSFKSAYIGYAVRTGEKVVIGVPHENVNPMPKDNAMYEKEQEEMRLLDKAQGEGVCKYHTCFKIGFEFEGVAISEPRLGMILHYYNGGDLQANLSTLQGQDLHKRVPAQLLIMKRLAVGLKTIHEAGIVHRDIKPQNIMLVKDEKTGAVTDAVFIDFGSATQGETHDGSFQGSMFYASPRQFSAMPVDTPQGRRHKIRGGADFSDDVWALGMSFYQMLFKDKVPQFTHKELLYKLFAGFELSPDERQTFNDFGGKNEVVIPRLLKQLAEEAKKKFNVQRPEPLVYESPSDEQRYEMMHNQMEMMCWDMLFLDPPMTDEKVIQRIEEIGKLLPSSQQQQP